MSWSSIVPQMQNKRTGERGGGYMLIKPLTDTATALGVRTSYNMPVGNLIVGQHGRVVGVTARQYRKTVAIRACRGVVLASGGFAYNNSMVSRYAPRLAKRPAASIEEHDGVAIRMAQAVGADLAHMDTAEVAFFVDPQLLVRGSLVNGRGQRYVAEDTYPGRIGQLTLHHQDDNAYLVIDADAHAQAVAAPSATPQLLRSPTWVCENVAALEQEVGLPAGALQATVTAYNQDAERGQDPLLHKTSQWLKPIGSPIGAIDLCGKTADFTLGGVCTTLHSEVLPVSGEPIPGLLAAGRATAGLAAGATPAPSHWATAASTGAAPGAGQQLPASRRQRER
jgi:3-oxo-5alpha-steroid 4-dehydrogenase